MFFKAHKENIWCFEVYFTSGNFSAVLNNLICCLKKAEEIKPYRERIMTDFIMSSKQAKNKGMLRKKTCNKILL